MMREQGEPTQPPRHRSTTGFPALAAGSTRRMTGDDVRELWGGQPAGRPVLRVVWPRHPHPRRRATCGHRGLRRHRRLHHSLGEPRSRAGEAAGRRRVRTPRPRCARLRRSRGQDRRRRHRGAVRRPGRSRGRCRAGGSRRAPYAGDTRRVRDRIVHRHPHADRREHRRSAGRGAARRRRLHRDGRRGEHGIPPRDVRQPRRGARRRSDLPGHPRGHRLRVSGLADRSRSRGGRRRVGGDRGARSSGLPAASDHPAGRARHRAHGAAQSRRALDRARPRPDGPAAG